MFFDHLIPYEESTLLRPRNSTGQQHPCSFSPYRGQKEFFSSSIFNSPADSSSSPASSSPVASRSTTARTSHPTPAKKSVRTHDDSSSFCHTIYITIKKRRLTPLQHRFVPSGDDTPLLSLSDVSGTRSTSKSSLARSFFVHSFVRYTLEFDCIIRIEKSLGCIYFSSSSLQRHVKLQ